MRLLRTGANLGYGTAVNRAVAEIGPEAEFFVVANPDVQWGPRCIDMLLEAAARWPRAGVAGTADPRPRRFGVPVGAPPAQPDPGRHARGRRPVLEIQPVDGRIPAGANRAQRTPRRLAVGFLPVATAAPPSMRSAASTSAISCIWRTSTWVIASAGRAGRTYTCRRRRFCTTRVTRPVAIPPATWQPTTGARTLSWPSDTTSSGRPRFGGRCEVRSRRARDWWSAGVGADRKDGTSGL